MSKHWRVWSITVFRSLQRETDGTLIRTFSLRNREHRKMKRSWDSLSWANRIVSGISFSLSSPQCTVTCFVCSLSGYQTFSTNVPTSSPCRLSLYTVIDYPDGNGRPWAPTAHVVSLVMRNYVSIGEQNDRAMLHANTTEFKVSTSLWLTNTVRSKPSECITGRLLGGEWMASRFIWTVHLLQW
jgi:hypothetical protein